MPALRLFALAAAALSLCAGPAAAQASAHSDPAAPDVSQLLAADRALSEAAGSRGLAEGLGGGLADDVVFLHPGQPIVRGAAAARALLAADPRASARVRWTPLRGDVSADGTRGYTLGWIAAEAAGKETEFGKYIAFWRHGADGAWRIAAYVHVRGTGPEEVPEELAAAGDADGAVRAEAMSADAARAAIVSADSAFAAHAARAGITDAFHAFAAPDAAIPGEGRPTTWGREAIGQGPRGPGGPSLAWAPLVAEAAESGDLGFTVGEAVLTLPAAEGAEPRRHLSKYLTVWKRQPDGAWRYVADTGNERPAEG